MARLIGGAKTASSSAASGIWTLNEQRNAKAAGNWPVTIGTARYWRWLFTQLFTNTQIVLGDIELHETVGGADVTAGKTATASSSYIVYTPDKLIDDNSSTYWTIYTGSVLSLPVWYQIDMGSAVLIAEYALQIGPDYVEMAPKSWQFQQSDDAVNWITVHTVTNAPSWSALEKRTYNGF